jgi:hypothetical protein
MSARDAESGSSTYKGGSGRAGGLGNGGIGGGMGGGGNYGGGMGGGAGRNGGIGNRTGLTTGNRMVGGVAKGRPGGLAMNPGAWGVRPTAPVRSGPMGRPAVPGLLGATPAPVAGVNPVPETVPAAVSAATFQNPYEFNPTTIPKAVSELMAQYQQRYGSPPPSAPKPGLSYNYNIKLEPGQSPYAFWGGGGLAHGNLPANRGPSTMTQSWGPGGDQWGPNPETYDERTGAY